MRLIVAARRLIAELARDGELEVRVQEVVARELCAWLEELERMPSGAEVSDWLQERPLVDEIFADEELIERRMRAHLGDLFAAPVAAADAHHPELERALLESPDNVEAYLVYSDWLQEAGDPLGELIALGVAADAGGAKELEVFERHLGKYRQRFLGRFASLPEADLALTWRCGLVREIAVKTRFGDKDWGDLLGQRALVGVERLSAKVSFASIGECAQQLRELAPSLPPSCGALCLEGFAEINPAQLALPEFVRELELRGMRLVLTDPCPDLDVLALYVGWTQVNAPISLAISELRLGCGGAALEMLDAADAVGLETLVLDLEGGAPEIAISRRHLTGLRELAVIDGFIEPQRLGELVAMGTALRSLRLVRLALDDDGAAVVAAQLESLESLELVDASDNELTAAGLARLSALDVEVESRRQERPGSGAIRRIRRFAGTRFRVADSIADPKKWRALGVDGDVRWGHYTGTEAYELFVTSDLERYRCSCPSSDQPCKHVVALALIAARSELPEKKWQGAD